MTVQQLYDMVMIQTGNDTTDITDYATEVAAYVNEGYSKLYEKYMNTAEVVELTDADESPLLPDHMHRYIADWATWRMYMNGNPSRQQRGFAFKQSFDDFFAKVPRGGGITDTDALEARAASMRFKNLY